MLDLYKLELFLQVVAEGSFSAAAARLLMSQSGVSQHIQELERSLGVTLFVRSPRGVQLTVAGQTLLGYAERMTALAAEAEAAVTDVSKLSTGQVAVGATPGVSIYILAEWVQSFQQRHTNLTVYMQTEITPNIVELLLAGQLDLGMVEGELTALQASKLGVHPLEPIPHFVVVGRQHPFWMRERVALEELDEQVMVVRQRGSQTRIWLEATLAAHGIMPQIGAEFDNVESMKRVVMGGKALTILPAYVVQDDAALGLLRAIPLQDEALQRILKLIWDKRRHFSPVARALLRHLSSRFPALLELRASHIA